MGNLILNSFPVEITPYVLRLPTVEFESWEASTEGRNKKYSQYRTYRYLKRPIAGTDDAPQRVRLVLLSGPTPTTHTEADDLDIGDLAKLGTHLIESSLSRHLESQGMRITNNAFETLALRRVESSYIREFPFAGSVLFAKKHTSSPSQRSGSQEPCSARPLPMTSSGTFPTDSGLFIRRDRHQRQTSKSSQIIFWAGCGVLFPQIKLLLVVETTPCALSPWRT
jgi:hypothetical protein